MTVVPIIVGLSGSIVFLVVLAKLIQRNRLTYGETEQNDQQGWSEEWFQEFSSFRYLPMRRLLSDEEEAYWLHSTEGGENRRAEFRAQRRRLFREYLHLISSDFGRLSQGVRLAAVHASEDRSAEISHLITLQWSLRKLLWQAEVRLMLHWLSVQPIDATQLINALQGFEFSIREMQHTAAAG